MRAVFLLTLRDGPDAISLAAVARELDLSTRSLQRLPSSTRHLPKQGLEWAERERRHRMVNARRPRARDPRALVVASIVEVLPGAPAAPDDQRVWWARVTAFEGTSDWACSARAEHDLLIESLSTGPVEIAGLDGDQDHHERERLGSLVTGTRQRILSGRLEHAEGLALIRRHLIETFPALREACEEAA